MVSFGINIKFCLEIFRANKELMAHLKIFIWNLDFLISLHKFDQTNLSFKHC